MVLSELAKLGSQSGYDAMHDTYIKNMIEYGIVDPLRVTKVALMNAASAAGTFLTTSVAIVDDPKDNKKEREEDY